MVSETPSNLYGESVGCGGIGFCAWVACCIHASASSKTQNHKTVWNERAKHRKENELAAIDVELAAIDVDRYMRTALVEHASSMVA